MDNVFTTVINLASDTERMQTVSNHLNDLGIEFERLNAVNGRELDSDVAGYSKWRYALYTAKEKNPGELGCYFSHIEALKRFVESGEDYGLIMEDDVNFPIEIKGLLKAAIDIDLKWDILRLSSSKNQFLLGRKRLLGKYDIGYNILPLKNTAAYVISLKAAKVLIKKLMPMRQPYDVALDQEWRWGLRAASLSPLPVLLKDDPGSISKAKRIKIFRYSTFHLYHLTTKVLRMSFRTLFALFPSR